MVASIQGNAPKLGGAVMNDLERIDLGIASDGCTVADGSVVCVTLNGEPIVIFEHPDPNIYYGYGE